MLIADLAVVTARLPYVDRSTLSQAWYDALHLAHPQNQPRSSPSSSAGIPFQVNSQNNRESRPASHSLHSLQKTMKTPGLLKTSCGPEMRARLHTQNKNISRCTATAGPSSTPKLRPQQETAIMYLPDGERICLITRYERGNVRLIALCAEHMHARVSMALTTVQGILRQQGRQCAMNVGEIQS